MLSVGHIMFGMHCCSCLNCLVCVLFDCSVCLFGVFVVWIVWCVCLVCPRHEIHSILLFELFGVIVVVLSCVHSVAAQDSFRSPTFRWQWTGLRLNWLKSLCWMRCVYQNISQRLQPWVTGSSTLNSQHWSHWRLRWWRSKKLMKQTTVSCMQP